MGAMSLNILFVCHANVCRSPMMEYEFRAALTGADMADHWEVASRGTSVLGQSAICSVCADVLDSTDMLKHAHVPRGLTAAKLVKQDMVVVATKAERASVAQASPLMRSRTFTLREAIHLGSTEVETESEREFIAGIRQDGHAKLRDYAMLLHGRRGLVAASRPSGRLPFFGKVHRTDPLDIPDAHHSRMRSHRAMLRDLQSEIRIFHSQVSGFLSAYSPQANYSQRSRLLAVA